MYARNPEYLVFQINTDRINGNVADGEGRLGIFDFSPGLPFACRCRAQCLTRINGPDCGQGKREQQ